MDEKKSSLSAQDREVLALVNEISDLERQLTKKKFQLVDMVRGNNQPEIPGNFEF